ncbi:MAG: hypothetical protein JXB00_03295 [Bacteroidales bacterium]|nr:hypothetical protein [Bacteroidales bacterium]
MANKKNSIQEKVSENEEVNLLLKLEECSWKEYERRHSSEWQVNFGLWSGLGVMTGFSIKERYTFDWWWIASIFILIALLYIRFRFGVFKSNRNDQDRRFYYLKEIHIKGHIELPRGYDKVYEHTFKAFLFNWSHSSQIIITILLLLIAFLGLTGIVNIAPCK